MGSCWSLEPTLLPDSVEPSRLLARPHGMGSHLHYAYYLGIICLLSTSCSRPIFLAVAGLGAPLSRLLEGLYISFQNERLNERLLIDVRHLFYDFYNAV